ncbi:MAG: IS66 family insertion sequence element accessory protein TnpB [Oscillospiraceae bacterium]|nr:IS66 family insertion sequence element accessory protein TnpB [Oscillospiraceae bacterium]
MKIRFITWEDYLTCGLPDLRRGIDGMAGFFQKQFKLDIFDDTLFLFCGRRNDKIRGSATITDYRE